MVVGAIQTYKARYISYTRYRHLCELIYNTEWAKKDAHKIYFSIYWKV